MSIFMKKVICLPKIFSKIMILRIFMMVLLLFILFSNITIPVFAVEQISFQDAVKVAFENNNELLALKSSLMASNEDIAIVRSNLLPKLRFDEVFINTNNPALVFGLKLNQRTLSTADILGSPRSETNPAPLNSFITAITLEQPIFVRQVNVGISMAKKEFESQKYSYCRKKEEVTFKVAQAYLAVDQEKNLVVVAQKAVKEAEEILNAAQIMYGNKKCHYSDILRASTVLTDSRQKLISAQKNLEVSKRALGLALGKQESFDIQQIDFLRFCLKSSTYYNDISAVRNDVKAIELKYENAKNNIKLAETDYFPTIGTLGSYQFYDDSAPFGGDGHNYIAAGFLKWYAFDGLKAKHEKRKAQNQVTEAYETLEGFKKQVSYQVYEAYLGVEEAKQNLELSSEELKTSEEGRMNVFQRYKDSQLTLIDLLDTQSILNQTRVEAVYNDNKYKNALVNLCFESGTITKDLNIE